jgi:hypothetical protein
VAKPIARKKGVHKSEGTTVSFSRDDKTGLYRKSEQKYRVNHLDHVSKKIGKPEDSEELYEISTEEEYDYKFEVSAPGGKNHILYFKKHVPEK